MDSTKRLLGLLIVQWAVVYQPGLCAPTMGPQSGMVTMDGPNNTSIGMATVVNGMLDELLSRLSDTWLLNKGNDTDGMLIAVTNSDVINNMMNKALMVTASPQLQMSAGLRMEIQLVRFENPGSSMYDGQYCDTTSKCDPRFFVDLDL